MSWKKIKKYLPIIGIALFVYLIIRLDIVKIFKEIRNFNFSYLPFILFFVFLFLTFQTLKWFVIAKKQKIKIDFKEAFKINLISNFYGFVTPAKLGSIIRAEYLRKEENIGKGLSNFVIDKILDLSSLFILAIFFGFVFYTKIIPTKYLYTLITFFLVLIFLSLIFYKKEYSKFILRFFYRKLVPEKMKNKAKIAFNSFYDEIPSLTFLLFVLILNLINWIINYTTIYFIGLSLGINLNVVYFLAILPISTLIAQIPITISGLGTRELTMISLFGLFGIESVKVFSMSMLGIFILNIIPSIIAILILFKEK